MNPGWWGAIAVVVVGAAVVWFGWWNDRRRNRAIPGGTAAATCVTEAEIQSMPLSTGPDADLVARCDDAATLSAGVADAWFLRAGLAGLDHPDVLVLDADLKADGDVATLLVAAKRRGRPLVIVGPGCSPAAIGTLRANAAKGTVSTLPLDLTDAAARRRAVALTGGRLVPAEDVASGWLPTESWGACDAWLADADDSWVVVAGRGEPGDADPRPSV